MKYTKKIMLLFISLFTFCVAVRAQKETKFAGAARVGLLNGQADKAGTELQLVGGLSHKTWFGGIGAGLDYYASFKTLPVFIDVRKNLSKKENTPFVSGNIGYNLGLKDENYGTGFGDSKFEKGLYYELSAGYKFILTRALSLSLSAGYSYKAFSEKSTSDFGNLPYEQPLPSYTNTYDYKFRRISFKVGFWF